MQLTVQLESTEGQLQAQKRSLDMGIDEKNEAILNLDRQLREKTQRIEQLQIDLQRNIRQMENQQILSNKTIQSLKSQIDELLRKNVSINEKCDEQNHLLVKATSG
jgi:predicted RNase H-like nuclease (RuvC/YqgF family)